MYYQSVILRNPYKITRLSMLSRLQIAAYRQRRRTSKRFIGRPAKYLYKFLRQILNFGGTSEFSLELEKSQHSFQFRARNTQFGALFMPQNANGYEPEVTALLDLLIEENSIFYDIGSNWGFFTLYALSNKNFNGSVHAFEPNPTTFDDLNDIADQSPFRDRITCHQIALSDHSGTARMELFDGIQSGLARLTQNKSGFKVNTACLDDMNLPAPDIIKMDVEGHEEETLKGTVKILSNYHPMIIFENWLEPNSPEVTMAPLRLLKELGYCFFQPVWSNYSTGSNFSVYEIPQIENSNAVELVLEPIIIEQRFLLTDQINIFACHDNNLAKLNTIFNRQSENL
jgi:FkbM family methyltransferase